MIKVPQDSNYWKNESKFPCKGPTYPCVICGRPCPKPKFMVWLHMGGTHLVTVEEGEKLRASGKDEGDVGGHPIGSDCLKKHPELKPYAWKV